MDTLKAVNGYLDKMFGEVPGMKVLLLDGHTTPVVSLATTQTSLLAQEIYLTERVENNKRDRMAHLNCIMFLSPDPETLEWVKEELAKPKYGGYWLYFSNVLTKSTLETLAQADEFEMVREVQEYFADYLTLLPSLFTLALPPTAPSPKAPTSLSLYGSSPQSFNPTSLDLHVQGVLALLLSLKKKPVIRWEKMSGTAKKLAEEVGFAMSGQQAGGVYGDLFNFRGTSGPAPLLMILDRRNDPVTPLLSQWTYQAMVHELIGIANNRVRLEDEKKPELKDVILSPSQDPFFASHLFSNFGDLGADLNTYVQDFSKRSLAHSPSAIESIADMKKFVEEYPEFRKLGGNVSKHVALVGELSRIVERDKLLAVSEVEQSLASNESHTADLKSVLTLLSDREVPDANKLRLAILYALRYQKFSANAIPHVTVMLVTNGMDPDRAKLVYAMLNYAGADQRQDDLFMNGNLFSRGKSLVKGLQGVENVYTQHKPHLLQTLDNLLKGRLRETSYPFLDTEDGTSSAARTQRPQDIIVFMVGGTTFEEARAVSLLNQQLATAAAATSGGASTAPRILLGGSCMHNSTSFLDMVESSATNFAPSFYSAPVTLTSVPAPLNISLPRLDSFLPPSSTATPSPPPADGGASAHTSTSPPPAGGSAINLRLGGFEIGTAGVYRTGTAADGQPAANGLQIDPTRVREGLNSGLAGARDFGGSLLGKMRTASGRN